MLDNVEQFCVGGDALDDHNYRIVIEVKNLNDLKLGLDCGV